MANRDVKRGGRPPEKTPPPTSPTPPTSRYAKIKSLFGSRPTHQPHHRSDRPRDRDRDRDLEKGRDHDKDKDRNTERDKDGGDRARHRQRKQDLHVQVKLRHLDHRHQSYTLDVKLGAHVSRIKNFIRNHLDDRRRQDPEAARIRIYSDGKEIHRHNVIDRSCVIWYRIEEACDDGSWEITYRRDCANKKLFGEFVNTLVHAIENGATVSQVRRMAADHLGITDHNRIILTARDGMRKGPIPGDSWEVRQIRSWLCRWLSIDVSHRNGYVVLEGLGRQYVYHPESSYLQQGMDLKRLKRWMEHSLFANVCMLDRADPNLKCVQIVLIRDGRRLRSSSPVLLGATYSFQLADDVAEALADDESWLLPATKTCIVCSDDKKITELPVRMTADCDHEPSVCKECMRQWIHSSLETNAWDRLKCPECPQYLKFHDVRRYASGEDFGRYDTLATRAALKDMPNFRWCLSTKCESGQIHDRICAKFKCAACKSKHCVRHGIPWHSGETCDEYDKRNRRRRRDEKKSEAEVKKSTKKCPECKKDVHKWMGCDHITCVCGHEWCYVCLAPFRRNDYGNLYCRHNPGCTQHDLFAVGVENALPPGLFGFPPPLRPRPWIARDREAAVRGGQQVPPPPPLPFIPGYGLFAGPRLFPRGQRVRLRPRLTPPEREGDDGVRFGDHRPHGNVIPPTPGMAAGGEDDDDDGGDDDAAGAADANRGAYNARANHLGAAEARDLVDELHL